MTSWHTPPRVAERYGVDIDKVYAWIRAGELEACNCATRATGRPRFRISPEALERFEARRSARPAPKSSRRSRRNPEVKDYFAEVAK